MSANEDPNTLPERREQGLLAVAHAAFNTDRMAQRRTILVDSILYTIHRVGSPVSEARLVQELRKLYETSAISGPLVHAAVADARKAGLVRVEPNLLGDEEWSLTDAARRDVITDAGWADGVLLRFEDAIRDRLRSDAVECLIPENRHPAVVRKLGEALAMGAEGLYAVALATSPNQWRPLKFNESAAMECISTLEPKTVRDAGVRLLLAAMDPRDPFGDEYIGMLTAANVLHGMATGRDLDSHADLVGTRVLLDTSMILGIADPGSAAARAVEEIVKLTLVMGAELVVAEHSIDEWRRLFESADRDAPNDPTHFGAAATLLDNPFLRAFVRQHEESDRPLTWGKYRAIWENPTKRLEQLGIKVRPAGNGTDDDRKLVAAMIKELRVENRNRSQQDPKRPLRLAAAIDADAESAAMIARWRRDGVAHAFFVSQDRMSLNAYRRAAPRDVMPLCVTPAAWAMFVAGLRNDDPTTQSEFARIVANAAVAQSYFAIATNFTFEEVQAFSNALAGAVPEVSDVHEFIQATLEEFEAQATDDTVGRTSAERVARATLKGASIRDSRAARKEQRAKRSESMIAEVERRAEDRGKSIGTAEATSAFTEALLKQSSASAAQHSQDEEGLAKLAGQLTRAKRRFVALVALVLTLVPVGVFTASNWPLDVWQCVLLIAAVVLIAVGSIKYLTDETTSLATLVGWLLVSVALAAASLAVDRLTDGPTPTNPTHVTTTT
ncbi:MAG: hypothetical protein JWM34_1065 [Ilumatobacteraceae bacterium]|nr:hypothetical protein [Ilumatobacteraceae bacterium]